MNTVFFGQFFGIVFVLLALGVLSNRDHATQIVSDLVGHAASQMVAGIIPLLLGVWVVLSHNVWVWQWELVVTLTGWLLLLSGVFRLWCVHAWVSMMKKHQNTAPLWGGIITLVIGLLLLYVGFHG